MTIKWKIGDCQDLMQEMEPDSVELIVTDPQYGYNFMNLDWDKAVPTSDLWKEALRVLKPGAFAFIMSAPRQDVLAHNLVNLSDAGFETGFTSIYWTFSSGFPKALNIEKKTGNKGLSGAYAGFQPKPAVEVIMVVMKPLSESTYVDQALNNQKGITWLDDGRIPYQSDDDKEGARYGTQMDIRGGNLKSPIGIKGKNVLSSSDRRFPANLLVSDDVLNTGEITESKRRLIGSGIENVRKAKIYGTYQDIQSIRGHNDSGSFSRYFDLDAWFDTKLLPKEAQTFPFMITPKASKSEKSGATHPTIKPVKLFSWLMTIGSRKGDLVLDPFLGSGTALEAGYLIDRDVLGFELDPQWEKLYGARSHKHQGSLEDWF